MDNLVNLTPFAVTALPSMDRSGAELLLVVLSARHRLPPAGRSALGGASPCEDQGEVRLTDEYWGDPATSSLRYEGQTAYTKPGTDIHLLGHAWAPGGRRTPQASLGLAVGSSQCLAVVFGERYWTEGLGGLRPSAPKPFERLPIIYERCFGGPSGPASSRIMEASERNPVGAGLVHSSREALGRPLPNFEDPRALVHGPGDLPRPVGFGPLGRHWRPRRDFAGTYDEAWVRTRAPVWPADFDERFFCAAPPSLCASPPLGGGETVSIVGAHPDGAIAFVVPTLRSRVTLVLAGTRRSVPMAFDTLTIEPDDGVCTMTLRAALPVGKALARLESITVRLLEPWEAAA